MKKFEFSLSKMKGYKAQLLDREKNALAALRAESYSVSDSILEIERQIVQISEKMIVHTSGGVSVNEIRQYKIYLDSLAYAKREKIKELEHIEQLIDKQILVVTAANQDLISLDKLEERQLEEYNYKVLKADEVFISEFVNSKIARELVSNH